MPGKAISQHYTKAHEFSIYAIVIAVTVMFSVVIGRLELARVNDLELHETEDVAIEISSRLSESLSRKLLLARVLTGAIALEPDQSQADFNRFASRLAHDEPAIVDIATVRDYQIVHVYPADKNEKLIGFDLRTRPEQAKVLETVELTGEMVLQGPINLIQGYTGYIIRQPVFVDENIEGPHNYWGLVSIVFSEEIFLQELNLGQYLEEYDIAIQVLADDTPVRTILGSPDLFEQDSLTDIVDLKSSDWSIAILPKGGWATFAPGIGLKVLATIFAGIIALGVARYLYRLREEAWRNAARLSAAIDVLPDGFVLFGRDDRLLVFNDQYRRLYSESYTAIKKGATFEEIIRCGLRRQQYPDAIGREEEWLAERMATHRSASSLFEQKLKEGRTLRVIEKEGV